MSIEAIFKINHEVESLFNADLMTSIKVYENVLNDTFVSSNMYFIGHTQHMQLVEIVYETRRLSYNIQHCFVSCRLFVTVAQDWKLEVSNKIYGTYAFGLDRVSGTERRTLIEPKPITDELLETFHIDQTNALELIKNFF
jgi:hypothetical protein